MSIFQTFMSISLVALVVSCSKPQSSDVPGNYRANRAYGVEMLHLRPQGTYEQVFTSASVSRTNVGRWKLSAGDPSLFLYDALIFDDGWGRLASTVKTGVWCLQVEKFAGQVSLVCGESERFDRQKP